jgi:acyl-coenzyme A synthetase/AMP-(fatty) acid ligase
MSAAASWLRSFASAVASAPGRDAIVTDSRRITYRRLAETSGGLQRRLGTLGHGTVVIRVDEAVDRAVAVVACIAAGRPHVLIDPARDLAGAREIASGVSADVVVGPMPVDGIPWHVDPRDLSTSELEPVQASDDAPFAFVSTSGSVGDPKWVTLTLGLLRVSRKDCPTSVRTGDRAFRAFNHSGNSLNVLLDALSSGASFLSADPLRIAHASLITMLAEERATLVRMNPSLLRLVAMQAVRSGASLPDVRAIGGGGERLLWSDVEVLRALLREDGVVHHGYASTETRGVTRRLILRGEELGQGPVPAGYPLPGRQVWIDTGDGRPAPSGVVGHVMIEGAFGTIGPEFEPLTDGRSRFRSGDLGELTSTGELILRGRSDRVVKISAVRVDAAVVEDLLLGVDGVVDACVVPTDVSVGQRLIAHVVVVAGGSPSVDSLRKAVSERLVGAAVPARFVVRTEPFPRLPSGKTDVRSLLEEA